MLEIIQQWGLAARDGGPWFLVALLGAIIFFGGRWLLGRSEKTEAGLRHQIEEFQKAAIEREKVCADEKAEAVGDQAKALADQAKIHEERYDALREESRDQHNRRNDEIREVAVTMTSALNQDAAAKHLQAKALDELKAGVLTLADRIGRNG